MKKLIHALLLTTVLALFGCGGTPSSNNFNGSTTLADFGNLPEDPYASAYWPQGCPDPFDLRNSYDTRFNCLVLYLINLPDGTKIAQPYFIYTRPKLDVETITAEASVYKPGPGDGSTQCDSPNIEVNSYAGQRGLFSNCRASVSLSIPLGGGGKPSLNFSLSTGSGSANLSINSSGQTNYGGSGSSGGLLGRRDYEDLCPFGDMSDNPACW
jgi:hypothetical protein